MRIHTVRRIVVERRWWVAGLAVVIVAAVVWVLLAARVEEPPRARQYLEFTACLLTDDHGIAGTVAAPVWAGMQDASLATRAKVQYVAVAGPQTRENAITFLNSLAVGGCDLIFAAGEVPVAAVGVGAAAFPKGRFYAVGGGSSAGNVTRIDGDARSAVRELITAAVNGQ
jgi:basic membrane lipoprotein Med (substrate-binding protein (PBP1-ABC) superfamily)